MVMTLIRTVSPLDRHLHQQLSQLSEWWQSFPVQAARDPRGARTAGRAGDFAQHQTEFEESRDLLLGAIDHTSSLLSDLRDFNKNKRIIHYAAHSDTHKAGPSRPGLPQHRRTQSIVPSHSQEEADADLHKSVDSAQRPMPPSLMRFNTTQGPSHASLPNTPQRHVSGSSHNASHHDDDESESTDMSVLKLDLRVGSVAANPQALVRSLERSSVAQLLDGRMEKSERHLENLKQRLSDTQSKVLVTGDLNAGKSTFVNALLRRPLMPTDQQTVHHRFSARYSTL